METSPLAVESFSYSWLINVKHSLDGLGSPLRTSLDISDVQNFQFDVPTSSVSVIHADEVFSNGFIVPVSIDPSKKEALDTSHSLSSVPLSSLPSRAGVLAVGTHCRKWLKSSKSALYEWFRCLRPLCRKVGSSRKSIRVDDIDRRLWEAKTWKTMPRPSLHQSSSYSIGDWCHMESSIHEAVLYCKKSIEK